MESTIFTKKTIDQFQELLHGIMIARSLIGSGQSSNFKIIPIREPLTKR